MSRPVTLFTGQWADLSLAELAPKVKAMGYDGVEPPTCGMTASPKASASAPLKK
jgi:sugar phosphate isomerase/epimerase